MTKRVTNDMETMNCSYPRCSMNPRQDKHKENHPEAHGHQVAGSSDKEMKRGSQKQPERTGPSGMGWHTARLQTYPQKPSGQGSRGQSQGVRGNQRPMQKSVLSAAIYKNETQVRVTFLSKS